MVLKLYQECVRAMKIQNRDKVEIVGEGNWLGKARRNFYLSTTVNELIHKLSLELGISHSAVIELAAREMYARIHGSVPPVPLVTRRVE